MSKGLHDVPEPGGSYKLALVLTLRGERFRPVRTDFGVNVLGDGTALPGRRTSRHDGPA